MSENRQQIIRDVELALEAIRAENAAKLVRAREEVYAKVSRIKEIDKEIRDIGLKAISDVMEGGAVKISVAPIRKHLPALRREKKALLKENGFSQNFLDEYYTCKKCNDKGILEGRYCECRQELIRRITYKLSGLKDIEHCDINSFKLEYYDEDYKEKGISARKNAANIVTNAVNFTQGNMLFYGNTGLGKTFLSSCIANKWMKEGKLVCYLSAPTLFTMIEDNKFGRDSSPKSKQILSMIYEADLLIIDDLGTEFPSAIVNTYLFTIINARLMSNLSTLINTNLEINEITEHYSERIASRLLGEYQIFRFFGTDIRFKKRKRSQK